MMFGHEIDKDNLLEYIPSKAGVLGSGFQCGPANFNVKFLGGKNLPLAEKVISTYRKEWAPEVPKMWRGLDRASLRAAQGTPTEAYGVEYKLEDGWLTARLPSGWQKMWYYAPRLGRDDKFDRECWSYSAFKGGKHTKKKMYGGLATENAVQGLARGLLCASIDRLERADMPVVLTIHDECVCEVDEGRADLKLFKQVMAEPTRWARDMGIPIAVDEWQGDRYRK
jgi:DNA polymerase